MRFFLRKIKAILLSLLLVSQQNNVQAEERSILINHIVESHTGIQTISTVQFRTQTDGVATPYQLFKIALAENSGLVTIFVQGLCYGGPEQIAKLIGTKIMAKLTVDGSADVWSTFNDSINSSGFYSSLVAQTPSVQASMIQIERRENGGAGTSFTLDQEVLTISEIRAYGLPELITTTNGVAIEATCAVSAQQNAQGLIFTNGNRSCGNSQPVYMDTSGTTTTNTYCFKADNTSCVGQKLSLRVTLSQEYFMHAILITDDVLASTTTSDYTITDVLHDYRIYIGNVRDTATDNPECAGGPFSTETTGKVGNDWRFGNEIWCNMPGKYMHIVADYSAISTWSVGICSLGILGNIYTPAQEPPASVAVRAGYSVSTDIYKVTAQLPLGNTLDIKYRFKAGTTIPSFLTLLQNGENGLLICGPDVNEPAGSHSVIVESYDDASPVKSALKTDTIQFVITAAHTPTFTTALPSQLNIIIGKAETWNLPSINADGADAAAISVTLTSITNSDLQSDLIVNELSQLVYQFKYTYSQAVSEHSGTVDISLSASNGLATTYTTPYVLQNASPPTFAQNPDSTVTVVEKIVKSFTYPSIVAGDLGSSTIVIAVQDLILDTHYTLDLALNQITFTASHQFYTDNAGQSKTITIKVKDDLANESEYTQTLNIQPFVPPSSTLNPLADFSFQNSVPEVKQVVTFIDGTIPIAEQQIFWETLSGFDPYSNDFSQDGQDFEPNIKANGIEWTYRGNSYTVASFIDTPKLFKYYVQDNLGQKFYFEHYFTLRSEAALSPPTFQTIPTNLVIMSGVASSYSYPTVSIGTFNKVFASFTLSDNNVGSWLTNNLPYSSFGAYDINSSDYTTWKDAGFATTLAYDGSTNIESFASDPSLSVTVVLTDRMQETGQSTYTQTITVQIAEAPTFFSSSADAFSFYTSEAKVLALPTVVEGNFGMDQAITLSTSDAGFASTLSINANSPFSLSYDGSFGTAHTGTITITLSNSLGKSTDYTTNYELLAPVAPSFTSAVADFAVIVGFDKTYSFPSIENGSHSPVTFSIAATVLSPSQYSFDDSARTIALLGSQSSYDSLAGSTITLTSTLSHAQASESFTQTVTISAYILPTFSEALTVLQLYPGLAKTVQYPSITQGSYSLAPTTLTVTPSSTLGNYLSSSQVLGEEQGNGKPQVEIYFPMDTLNLEYGGTSILKDYNMFGTHTFLFTLSDSEGGQTQTSQQVEIIDAVAPIFASELIAKFEITQRTQFTYEFPLITEGSFFPATSTTTMTSGLESSLVISQAQNSDNKLQITATYSGGDAIRTFADQTDLTVSFRLTDEQSFVSTDYTIQVSVAPIIYPVFGSSLQAEYKVYPGVPWVFTLPAITEGSRALQSLVISTNPAELSASFELNSAISDPQKLSYTGGIQDQVHIGSQSDITFTLTNIDGDETIFTKTLTIEKFVMMAFDKVSTDILVKVGEEIVADEHFSVKEGTFSPATATWTISPGLERYLVISQVQSAGFLRVQVSYDGSRGLNSFAGRPNLFLNLTIQDSIERNAIEYSSTVTIITAKTKDQIEESEQLLNQIIESLIKAPYFEPALKTSYSVVSDDILIELGDPIDPQGNEVSVSFDLSEVQEFLKAQGTKLSMLDQNVDAPLGIYTVRVDLSSEFEGRLFSESYSFEIKIQDPEIKAETETTDKPSEKDEDKSEVDEELSEENTKEGQVGVDQAGNSTVTDVSENKEHDGAGLSVEEIIDSITAEMTISEINDLIINALQIKNPELALYISSAIQKIDDETDLEEEAEFDFLAFLEQLNLRYRSSKGREAQKLPNFLIQQEMRNEFVIPEAVRMSRNGEVSFKISAEIKPISFKTTLKKLQKSYQSNNRRLQEYTPDDETTLNQLENDQELVALTQLLKLTNSITTTLVPADEFKVDQKTFDWTLTKIEGDEISLKFNFTNPAEISAGSIDTIKVSFQNTEQLLEPVDPNLTPIPSGFQQVIKLPPQGLFLMSEEQVQEATSAGQSFVLANFLIKFLTKQAMSMLFSSIILVQILAHLPLADITLPANALQSFDIMIDIVSFDYFSPTDYFEFGFSEMPPWSEQFEWLKYETINFVDGMGSILIFAILQILLILFALAISLIKANRCSKCKQRFNFTDAYIGSLALIHGTFFETLVCVSISMEMLSFYDYLTQADKVSIGLQFFFGVVLLAYIIFVCYFTIFKTGMWVNKSRAEDIGERKKFIKSVSQNLRQSNKKLSFKFTQEDLDGFISTLDKSVEKTQTEAGKIDESQFQKYEPLVEDLRTDSQLALLSGFYINFRRLMTLYLAMFVVGAPWLQMIVFMSLNFISLMFLVIVKPYELNSANKINILNEVISLWVSYLILCINGLSKDGQDSVAMGDFIVLSIYISWFLNIALVCYLAAKEGHQKFKAWYNKPSRLNRFKFCLRKKPQQKQESDDFSSINIPQQREPDAVIEIIPMQTPRFGVKPAPLREENDDFALSQRYQDYNSSRSLESDGFSQGREPSLLIDTSNRKEISRQLPYSGFTSNGARSLQVNQQIANSSKSANQVLNSIKSARQVANLKAISTRNNMVDQELEELEEIQQVQLRVSSENTEDFSDYTVNIQALPDPFKIVPEKTKLQLTLTISEESFSESESIESVNESFESEQELKENETSSVENDKDVSIEIPPIPQIIDTETPRLDEHDQDVSIEIPQIPEIIDPQTPKPHHDEELGFEIPSTPKIIDSETVTLQHDDEEFKIEIPPIPETAELQHDEDFGIQMPPTPDGTNPEIPNIADSIDETSQNCVMKEHQVSPS